MFLKTITIHGFKSFADPTRLDLQPGMTTIVGPNGCGKSNIADAIRWVLGEQSAKALRGSKMHDVIFQGSEQRQPLPFSEVSLLFSDCETELGTQYHEVEITRKVSRDAGSEYSLNGKVCRLKDILNLFMDTGVGQVSYSFLLQGQIDQILSSNPMERRSIFEEAAGITRYKAQRKEALNKLNLVEQNLTRVTDIIEEINKRMGTLKRQASKAVRFQRLKHRLNHLDIAWNANQFADLNSESKGIREKHAEAENKLKEIRTTIENLNRELTQRKTVKADIFQSIEELRSRIFTLKSAKENCANQEQIKRNRIEHLSERIQQLEHELTELKHQESSISGEDSEVNEQMTTQHSAVSNAETEYSEWQKQLATLDGVIREKTQELSDTKAQQSALENQFGQLRSQSTRLEVNLESYHTKHEELLETFHNSQTELESITQQTRSLEVRLQEKEQEKLERNEAHQILVGEIRKLEEGLETLQKEFGEIEKQHTHLAAEASILDNLQKKLEGFSAGTKAILNGSLEGLIEAKEVEVLSKFIEVDPEYQLFAETILGPLLESMVYENPTRLSNISQLLGEKDLGRASFLVPGIQHPSKSNAKAKDVLKPAAELVRTVKPSFDNVLGSILDGCFYCDTLEQALEFVKAEPAFDYELIATKSGELLTRKGCVNVGKSSGKSGTYLQRQNELRKLTQQIENQEKLLHAKSEELDAHVALIDEKKEAREESRDILATIEREISSFQTEKSGLERTLKADESRLANAKKQLETLETDRSNSEGQLAEVREKLELTEQQNEEFKVQINRCEQELVELRGKRDGILASLSDAKVVLSQAKQMLTQYQQTIADNRRRKEELERRTEQYNKEQTHSNELILKLRDEIEKDIAQAANFDEQVEQANVQLNKEEQEHRVFEEKISEIEASLQTQLEKERSDQESMQSIHLSLSEKDIHAKNLAARVREEYDLNLEAVDWRLELWRASQKILSRVVIDDLDEDADLDEIAKDAAKDKEPTAEELEKTDAVDWGEIQEEIQQLRTKINSMGPVNTLAIEEYADLKERYEFLKSQSDDLWNSKNQLVEAIDEINETSEQMFRETFEKIKVNFKDTYNRLTGGGEADLKLLDAEDVLDSGIDIIARPPGTRLRNLSLLSGGQKTMTAVALLFAIYIVKPSPFCVLDELDAPLDDANIGRFVDMLKDFTRFSQFLIVSHNKRTIAASDSIFGVTMEEKGVSKLISMRFSTDKELISDMIEH